MAGDNGFILLYRVLITKPIWQQSTPEQKVILITLLCIVNYIENEWEWKGEKFKVQPGQVITSLDSIVKHCGKGISIQNVRSALVKFEKYGFLTNESTKTGRLISIVNWRSYQLEGLKGNKEDNKEVTKNQQRGNKEVTPIEQSNKDNKDNKGKNNNTYTSDFETFWSLYPRPIDKGTAFARWNTRIRETEDKNCTPENIILAAQNYALECKRCGTETRYIKHPSSFLGTGGKKPFTDYINWTPISVMPNRKSRENNTQNAIDEFLAGEGVKLM